MDQNDDNRTRHCPFTMCHGDPWKCHLRQLHRYSLTYSLWTEQTLKWGHKKETKKKTWGKKILSRKSVWWRRSQFHSAHKQNGYDADSHIKKQKEKLAGWLLFFFLIPPTKPPPPSLYLPGSAAALSLLSCSASEPPNGLMALVSMAW